MATKTSTVRFNRVSVPKVSHRKPNPFDEVAAYLLEHIDDPDGAVTFKTDKPGYSLGKLRGAARDVRGNEVTVRAELTEDSVTAWAVTRRPRTAKKMPGTLKTDEK